MISVESLFDDVLGTLVSDQVFGCGLFCFTHPQVGTLRFDSTARQAQYSNCKYALVSLSRKASSGSDSPPFPSTPAQPPAWIRSMACCVLECCLLFWEFICSVTIQPPHELMFVHCFGPHPSSPPEVRVPFAKIDLEYQYTY